MEERVRRKYSRQWPWLWCGLWLLLTRFRGLLVLVLESPGDATWHVAGPDPAIQRLGVRESMDVCKEGSREPSLQPSSIHPPMSGT